PLPGDLFAPERHNSAGIEFGERAALERLLAEVKAATPDLRPVADATPEQANAAIAAARAGFAGWSRTPAGTRAAALEQAAHLLESSSAHFLALLQAEGGKTLDDALSELREAADFCRY
ncbi:aldehyde dehydrogenase family protein, partial [Klebsiella pneumoniae]|uniref:aldehyde dehydrogenase family protein n=2 Tax=Pseudomonadota TaxID=1224 RepID=UPI001C5EC4EA